MYHDSFHDTKMYQVIIVAVSLSQYHELVITTTIPSVCNQVLMCVFAAE